jgi:hypothetical protein
MYIFFFFFLATHIFPVRLQIFYLVACALQIDEDGTWLLLRRPSHFFLFLSYPHPIAEMPMCTDLMFGEKIKGHRKKDKNCYHNITSHDRQESLNE